MRVEMHQQLQCRKRLTSGDVNNGSTLAVESSPKEPCAFPCERICLTLRLTEPKPGDHVNTPCSNLPIRSSTSRAPISVFAYSSGGHSPSARCGVLNHFVAAARLPSNNATALSKRLERRRTRSDSSGCNRPSSFRRLSVRVGIFSASATVSRGRPIET